MENTINNKIHLFRRAAFGPTISDYAEIKTASLSSLIAGLMNGNQSAYKPLNVIDEEIKKLALGKDELGKPIVLTSEQRLKIREYTRGAYKNLNLTWLTTMVESNDQLREKMAFFWQGHFASRSINIFYQQQLLNVFREHALGNFKTLLTEASKSASIVNFLNNNQNRKGSPNENFSRELMELFTMGIGNYTEQDIKEAARAFTGWGVTVQGEFIYRKPRHDGGTKTFMGKTGNFNGFDIIDIILERKETARFITTKLYKYFVNDKAPIELINQLAERFYNSNYNIRNLMLDIFSSDWFYNAENKGIKIKSPVELITGIRRALPMDIKNPEIQLLLQQLLGQELLFPPNVAGWPGGKSWIDGASLLLRLSIPKMIALGEIIDMESMQNDDINMGSMQKSIRGYQQFSADIDWNPLMNHFQNNLLSLKEFLVPETEGREYILKENMLKGSVTEEQLRALVLNMMSTPEFQLC